MNTTVTAIKNVIIMNCCLNPYTYIFYIFILTTIASFDTFGMCVVMNDDCYLILSR